MPGQGRGWVVTAALLAFLAVAAGAFAAHGLESQGDPRAIALVEKGSHYQMAHALAMLAYLALGWPQRLPLLLWAAGAVLFPGSLYALALGAPPAAAILAPIGGTAFLAGWLALAWVALKGHP